MTDGAAERQTLAEAMRLLSVSSEKLADSNRELVRGAVAAAEATKVAAERTEAGAVAARDAAEATTSSRVWAKVAAGLAAFIIVGGLFGGSAAIRANQRMTEITTSARNQSAHNEAILRVVLAVTGCTVTDTPAQCQMRVAGTSKASGDRFVAEVDCRVRAALAGKPPTPAGKPCVP